MSWRSLASSALLVLCGCGTGDEHGRPVTAATPVTQAPLPEPAPTPGPAPEPAPPTPPAARLSCRSTVAPTELTLAHAGPAVEAGGRSFALAWRWQGSSVDMVVASLDRDGALVVTPIPLPYADPFALGADAGGLVVVSVPLRGRGALLRVAIHADGRLAPGRPAPLRDVVWGWPSAIASDGEVAILTHAVASPDQTIGGHVVYRIDLAARRVIDSAPAAAGATAHCGGGACTTVEIDPTARRATFVRRARGGAEERLAVDVSSTCPAVYAIGGGDDLVFVAPGDPWRAVRSSPAGLAESAIDRSLAGRPGCGTTLEPVDSETRPGVIDGYQTGRSLLRWDAGRGTFGAAEALPDVSFARSERSAHPDGVIEVGWDGGSGMQHSPTDEGGRRRYFRHWFFERGEVSLLRPAGARWERTETVPLPLANANGTMHEGYVPIVLRNGLHAAVLLASMGSEPAWLVPYLAPCPPAD